MYPSGNRSQAAFDIDRLLAIGAMADVSLDFFLDPDIKQSTNPLNPKYEIMVWFAALNAAVPIGYENGSAGNTILGGKNYTLFAGQNNQTGQEVFSFVAPENVTSFSQLDVLSLFRYLIDGNKMPSSTYLGTAQFGTETFHTDGKNVTFEARGIDLTIKANSSPSAKSNAVSLKGLGKLEGCWIMLEVVTGTLMLWSWML